ncbi:MAG: spiro-SPASM protein [Treponema sp.]|nr:spiro-SPASM protein [Treponema sp.]
MKAITVLYGGSLGKEAFIPLAGLEKSSFDLAVRQSQLFPFTEKVVLLGREGMDYPGFSGETGCESKVKEFSLVTSPKWTRRELLNAISREQSGYDLAYFAWADCPFLDPALAAALTDRHVRYAAEYSYADGYPLGFAPELLSAGTAGVLFNIDKEGDVPVERDAIFQAIQKDINAFDIETEISPVDLRHYRICLAADSRRNLLLLNRWLQASVNFPKAQDAEAIIEKNPELLRTLPAFYNIQVCEACPQACSFCPWSGRGQSGKAIMEPEKFRLLLDKIVDFSGDAVISMSLWGEPALHPQKMDLIRMVLQRPELSLVIETSGVGWKTSELETLASEAKNAAARAGNLLASPLSWVVSLDAFDPNRYREIRGSGFTEAADCANQLLQLFPGSAYVQAVRFKGAEDDIEAFYRHWKEAPAAQSPQGTVKSGSANHVIIQKYDHFCNKLPKLQASDLSPVQRRPCWHLMRDMNIALDGTVLRCREILDSGGTVDRFNAFTRPLQEIWMSAEPMYGNDLYIQHTKGNYPEECADCDEYYTYNF